MDDLMGKKKKSCPTETVVTTCIFRSRPGLCDCPNFSGLGPVSGGAGAQAFAGGRKRPPGVQSWGQSEDWDLCSPAGGRRRGGDPRGLPARGLRDLVHFKSVDILWVLVEPWVALVLYTHTHRWWQRGVSCWLGLLLEWLWFWECESRKYYNDNRKVNQKQVFDKVLNQDYNVNKGALCWMPWLHSRFDNLPSWCNFQSEHHTFRLIIFLSFKVMTRRVAC